MKTRLLVEQHFHGCYGIDFNTASVDDILFLAQEIRKEGIGYIFPTLVTDSLENTRRQIGIIKQAAHKQTSDMAQICGVHLEGIFLNPLKKGIHNSDYFLEPNLDNFKQIEDDFIKIITLAPELTKPELFDYLKDHGIKIQAGHCCGGDLTNCDGTTHTFNAMSGITHRERSTALSALLCDRIFCEIIADGVHVFDDALKLLFKNKPLNRIILVSDCLPCTHSNVKEFDFAGEKVYFDGQKATSKVGTLAGSTKLLPEIIKILAQKELFLSEFINNSYEYHKLPKIGELYWDEDYNICEQIAK